MHEFSLAQGLHNQLLGLVSEHQAAKVLKAEVSVGNGAGIVVESFVFGFNVLAEQCEMTKGMNFVVESDDGEDLILQRVELE
ncbi:MAG: hydrogenase maturation nickel metallochaperone HypA [Candidatus Thiodiazotropha sp. (ex Rostrolucina anterorostrata)]|jgi:hydrogenase nickel incorporation protein HypA/HybF|nr:hydrogenase maturation nickel metallochaperone HypA [Candidatus Thiodiazotropha sp. (ex Rostrolucina anterorostrata)]